MVGLDTVVDVARNCYQNLVHDEQRDVFVGSHDGYRRLAEPIDHTRRIIFDKRRLTWVIEDTVSLRDLPATIVDILDFEADSPFPGSSLARYWNRKPAAAPASRSTWPGCC